MTSVYLAASWARQAEMRELRAALQAEGIEVTSRWLDEDLPYSLDQSTLNEHPEIGLPHGVMNVNDIEKADVVAVFTGLPSTTGGYHTELGIAIGMGKQIFLVGPCLNVFQCLRPQVQRGTVSNLLEVLR